MGLWVPFYEPFNAYSDLSRVAGLGLMTCYQSLLLHIYRQPGEVSPCFQSAEDSRYAQCETLVVWRLAIIRDSGILPVCTLVSPYIRKTAAHRCFQFGEHCY